MKRIVADTNVLVSAQQFGGKPKQFLDLAADAQVDLFRGVPIQRVAELLRSLQEQRRD